MGMKDFGASPVIPEGYVTKYYQMDPMQDEIVQGQDLHNGMRVLVFDPELRVDLDHRSSLDRLSDEKQYQAQRYNRWMVVSRIVMYMADGAFSFIGVYDDGTKGSFVASVFEAWYVKLSTMPQPVTEEAVEADREKLVDDTGRIEASERIVELFKKNWNIAEVPETDLPREAGVFTGPAWEPNANRPADPQDQD